MFHEFLLFERELTRGINLFFGCGGFGGLEARVDGCNKGNVVRNLFVFFGGDDKGEVSKVGLVGGD